LVALIRRGTTGKFLDALRGSETAAASLGISPARARVIAFALSAAIAGLGGGLITLHEEQANYTANFVPFFGLFWLVLVVTLGARTVEGAIQAGFAFALVPELLKAIHLPAALQFVGFGLAAITYAKHPEGIVEYGKRRQLASMQRRLDRRNGVDREGASPEVPRVADVGPPPSPKEKVSG